MPAPGDHLADRYRILALLGTGGMATVHRAHDDRLDRDVAVKVLLPNLADDPVVARRFEREARSMAAVAHPGLVAVFDVDAGDAASGREPFVVMELCPGGSLADRMGPGRPMAPDELVPDLVAVADALGALHGAGLVHRDMKPSNILFATDRVKLADFGLVRSDGGIEAGELTDPGTAIGTLGYLAPERLRGEPGDPASDVFALATVAFLGLTGSLPRPTGSIRDLVASSSFRAPAVSAVAPALGTTFDEVISDGLAIDPGRRPDAVTFGARLAAALGAWARAGRPGADGADLRAVATTAPRPPGPGGEDATTALAIPIDATAPIPVPVAPSQPVADGGPDANGRAGASGGAGANAGPSADGRRSAAGPVGLLLGLLAVAVLVVLIAALGALLSPTPGPTGPRPTEPAVPSTAASPSVASPPPSPSAPPAASADPALAALDQLDAAIAGARGGRDGLKGKEANDLESRAARVRTDLRAGDRAKALRDAEELDKRIRDVSKGIAEDAGNRLRSASSALVAALED